MNLYIPKELKQGEGRVSARPQEVAEYRRCGGNVYVEKSAGFLSGFPNSAYADSGASLILPDYGLIRMGIPPIIPYEEDGWPTLILKVKEVILPDERWMIRSENVVVGFGHLAANRQLVDYTIEHCGTYVSLEDVVEPGNPPTRPVLKGMSIVAGEEAVRIGMRYINNPKGCRIFIAGFGNVGKAAARVGQDEYLIRSKVFDVGNKKAFHYLPECDLMEMSKELIASSLLGHIKTAFESDKWTNWGILPALIILAPYAPEHKTPIILTEEMLPKIPANSVIVDVSIDQGGACEFSQVTSHEHPYVELGRGIKYIGIPNLPGGVPQQSTSVFSRSVYPYIEQILKLGFIEALRQNPALRGAVSILNGRVASPGLAKTFGWKHTPVKTNL